MATTKAVGVTMFFNLKPLSDTTELTRSREFYEKNCVATLSINNPLVILCDSSTRAWIEPLRNSLSTAETQYIEKNITEYDHYKVNFPLIVHNRKTSPTYQHTDNRNTPSFLLTTTFKFHALKMAAELIQDATHYVWVDFGCQHVVWEAQTRLQAIFDNPRSKITMTYIHYRPSNDVKDMAMYLSKGGPCSLAATVFSIEKSYMNLFYTRCMSIFYEQLSKQVGHNEEQVLIYLYDRYPEMFNLVYGDYYSTVSNYHNVVRDYNTIKTCFINTTIAAGRKDLAAVAAYNIMESHNKGKIQLSKDELLFLNSLI